MPDEPEAPETPGMKLEIKAYARPDGDHPVYTAIGLIAAEWAYLEHLLDSIIRHLMPRTEAQRLAAVTCQLMGAAPRYRIITSLIKIEGDRFGRKKVKPTPERLIKDVNSLLTRTYDVSERRNRIIHDPWFIDTANSLYQYRTMPIKDPIMGFKDVDFPYLKETYYKITNLVDEIKDFRIFLYNALLAWQGKPPLPPPLTQEEMDQEAEILKVFLSRLKPSPE